MILAHSFPVARILVPVTINQDMKALKLREDLSDRFAIYLFTGLRDIVLTEVDEAGHGTRRLVPERLKNIEVYLPPSEEQHLIADFLDRETTKIDTLVAQKQRLIELLQEKRTALITRAVTKGLDPDVEMKDSGVEWLGEIPAHWDHVPLGRGVSSISGATPDRSQRRYWSGEVPWVSPKDMKVRYIVSAEEAITETALAETGIRLIRPPAVLIVVRGMILNHSFPVAVSTVPVTINQDMKALVPGGGLTSEFLCFALEGLSRAVVRLVDRAGHGTCKLDSANWKRFVIPLPPKHEQDAVCQHLRTVGPEIGKLIEANEITIDLLTEYRTALISAAVTGKIDVRTTEASP